MVMADYQSAAHNLSVDQNLYPIEWDFVFLGREEDRELLAVYRKTRIGARGSGTVLNIPNNREETNHMSHKYIRAGAQ